MSCFKEMICGKAMVFSLTARLFMIDLTALGPLLVTPDRDQTIANIIDYLDLSFVHNDISHHWALDSIWISKIASGANKLNQNDISINSS